jgi:hypothetical protein
MKSWFALSLLLLSTSLFAGVSLNVDFKDHSNAKVAQFKQTIETYFDEVKTFKLPNSNQEIEISVTDEIPEVPTNGGSADGMVLVDFKIYENKNGERKLISSPKVVTTWGKEASMESYKDDSRKHPLMTLKIIPKKI